MAYYIHTGTVYRANHNIEDSDGFGACAALAHLQLSQMTHSACYTLLAVTEVTAVWIGTR